MVLEKGKSECLSSSAAELLKASSSSSMVGVEGDSKIAHFYSGKSIFITGATGFMGKVLVEKLLRSCPSVKNIYLLLRGKNGQNAQQRLEDLFGGKVFDRLRKEQPTAGSKLVAVSGDISQPLLGLGQADLNILVNNVSVVFHSAATVKFDEPLKSSVDINLLGTRRLVELCHKMPLIQAFVHVSTAYCNCDKPEVDEVIYSPPVSPQHIIDTVEWMEEDLLNSITPKLIGGRPNTYTFTKALAETLLVDESGGLPLAIVRPSIVTAAVREPYPGWVDNLNGPTGLLIASGKGVLRSMLINSNMVTDLIPVDVVINLMLTVAWHTATQRPNNIMVYNCTSGTVNPLTWGQMERIAYPLLLQNPSKEIFRYPGGSFKSSRVAHLFCVLFQHYLPAACVDIASICMGKKARMVRLYHKIHKAVGCLEHFANNEWKFHCRNVTALYQQLSPEDKQIFHFDIQTVDWTSYIEDYLLGIREYMLKEDSSTIPAARKNLRRLYITTQLTNLVILVGIWRLLMLRSQSARQCWFFIVKLVAKLYSALPMPSFSLR